MSSALKFFIENVYFEVGGKLIRQKIGIPIGMDPAPFLANLFLAYYEIHWVKKIQRTDYGRARKYNNNFRFIDDL